MVTGYPHVLVGPQGAVGVRATRAPRTGFATRVVRRLGQMICGMSGHDLVRHYEQNRVSLACASCGHLSPGWELTAPMPQMRYAGDPARHQLRPPAPARTALARTVAVAPRRVA